MGTVTPPAHERHRLNLVWMGVGVGGRSCPLGLEQMDYPRTTTVIEQFQCDQARLTRYGRVVQELRRG